MERTRGTPKITISDKVRKSIERQKQERRERLKQHFKEQYNKVKHYQFPALSDINMDKHFYFPKIENPILRSEAFTVYAVLCSQADFAEDRWFQISEETIARMAGLKKSSVARACEQLSAVTVYGKPMLQRRKTTEGSRHFYEYKVWFIRQAEIEMRRGGYFIFYTCIIDSGIWASLTPRAKALYLAARSLSHPDELDEEIYDDNGLLMTDEYRHRRYDVCDKPLTELCSLVNVSRSNIASVLLQLEEHKLMEWLGGFGLVYLRPRFRQTDENGDM